MTRLAETLVRTIAPLLLALAAGGVMIWAMGADPFVFYLEAVSLGLGGQGWQQSLTAMAPLMLIALGLIIAFRGGLWNLGYGGSYLMTAAVIAGIAPELYAMMPFALATLALIVIGVLVGAALGLIPALLKIWHGTNEVITSLMVSFLAMSLASLAVRGSFQDPDVTVPQTRVLDLGSMLPYLPGTRVHIGVAVALLVVIAAHVVLTRSSFGLKLDMHGASPRAARHAGVRTGLLTLIVFLCSGAMFALAAVFDMLGLWGYMRADWNPGYGERILPFVFLARLNPLGSLPFVAFYAVLSTGGTLAAQRAGLSVDVLLVIVAFVLFFMVVVEALGTKRGLGKSYLPGRSATAGRLAQPRAGRERASQ